LSDALAATVTGPDTVAPDAGEVRLTVGAVVSDAGATLDRAIGLTPTPAGLPPPGLKLPSTAPDWRSNFQMFDVLALDAQKVPSPTRSRPPQ